ncbi:MAG: flagellar hook-associated protein FlgK [Succinivibrionaceae bacterium]
MADLLKIGTSGVLAHQQLLQTTSNNISNVSTAGYSRQETLVYTNIIGEGCGYLTTRRCIDTYAQKELLTDNANLAYYAARKENLNTVDSLLSNSSTGLTSTINELFDNIQSANTDPSSVANRNELIGSIDAFTQKVNTISGNIQNQYQTTNQKIKDNVQEINQILDGIYQMNSNIIKSSNNKDSASYLQMLDERDRLVTELSSYMDIRTVPQDDGSCYVNMKDGQTLVLKDGRAVIGLQESALDETEYQLTLSYNTSNSKTLISSNVGGSLQGYFDSCNDLKDTQREIGKLAWALADKLNLQNQSGLTLTNTKGSELFSIDNVNCTSNSQAVMTMSMITGLGHNVTGKDYIIKVGDDRDTFSVLEKSEGKLIDITKDVINGEAKLSVQAKDNGNGGKYLSLDSLGFRLDISGDGKIATGDEFLIQPTLNLGFGFSTAITKPEDLAFASILRCSQNPQNLGNATISLDGVFNTINNNNFLDNANTKITSLSDSAPQSISIDKDGNYRVYDKDNNLVGIALAETKGQNILENLYKVDAQGDLVKDANNNYVKLYNDYKKDPGYDFSISGTVKEGDTFNIEINTNGGADNSNGILLQNIQQEKIVYGQSLNTVGDSYTYIVSDVGTTVKIADINYEAAAAKQEQSSGLVDSVKGVELNEEASNLVKFQQCYAASAKIITAAQTIFDALINATR